MREDAENDDSQRLAYKTWLRTLRKRAGLSQEDVAGMLNVTRKTISNLESESSGFANGLTLLRYLQLLGVLVESPPAEVGRTIDDRLDALEEAISVRLKAAENSAAAANRSTFELDSSAAAREYLTALVAAESERDALRQQVQMLREQGRRPQELPKHEPRRTRNG